MMKTMRFQRSGQSLVELAVSLFIILLLLLGAIEFSLALFQYVAISNAAEEGAAYGSIAPTDETGIKLRAKATASDVIPQLAVGDISVTVNNGMSVTAANAAHQACEGLTGGVPNAMHVSITFAHPITFPLIGPIIGSNTIPLTAVVTNTILQPICP